MLKEDPRDRLSLCEVKDHPWMVNDEGSVHTTSVAPAPADEWRILVFFLAPCAAVHILVKITKICSV
jgi:hypothetical protein